MRHHRVDIDRRHTLLDRTLHAHQTNPVIVLHKLTNRAHAPVTEIINVINVTATVLQVQNNLHDRENVFAAQCPLSVFGWLEPVNRGGKADIHLHPANSRQIIALRIKEELIEQRISSFLRWRLTRAHNTVNVRQRLKARLILVCEQGIAHPDAAPRAINIQQFNGRNIRVAQLGDNLFGQLISCLSIDLTGFHIHDIACEEFPLKRS